MTDLNLNYIMCFVVGGCVGASLILFAQHVLWRIEKNSEFSKLKSKACLLAYEAGTALRIEKCKHRYGYEYEFEYECGAMSCGGLSKKECAKAAVKTAQLLIQRNLER